MSTVIKLKDGSTVCGTIWTWRPVEGFIELTDDDTGKLRTIELADVVSAVTRGARVDSRSPPEGENRDELARARRDGWRG